MKRRTFVKNSCSICILGSIGVSLLELVGCSAAYPVFKTEAVNKQIRVPLALFNSSAIQIIRPKGWYYDIAVEKRGDTYKALLLQCTHQENQLVVNGNNGYMCSLHGSTFDKDGKVRKGPAEKPLTQYETVIEQEQLLIKL